MKKEDTLILTCKLGNEIINCYDGTHNKEQLKKWASKKILVCPVCGKPYEYCHGKVKTPYFRHMDKNECEDIYSESETEEHLNGKRDLFEWIRKQDGVINVVLEGWIPETKQRPDIMFEYDGKKYIIEYQCSPIATEYVERHELYKASGINDIWILGTEKYLKKNMRKKYIQTYACGFYSYVDKKMILTSYGFDVVKTSLCYKQYCSNFSIFYGFPLHQFKFDGIIYNLKIGKPEIISEKIRYRENLKMFHSNHFPKRHNKYLILQDKKLYEQIEKNIYELSNNNNWRICIMYTYFIHVEPMIIYGIHDPSFQKGLIREKFKYINLHMMRLKDYDCYKKCARNIDYLKKFLLSVMEYNKQILLTYENPKIRFMEVRDN